MKHHLTVALTLLTLSIPPLMAPSPAHATDPEAALEQLVTDSILTPIKEELLAEYGPDALNELFNNSWVGLLAWVGFGITEDHMAALNDKIDQLLNHTLPLLENDLLRLFRDTYTPEEIITLAQEFEANPAGAFLSLPPDLQAAGLDLIQQWKTDVILPAVQSEVINSVLFEAEG